MHFSYAPVLETLTQKHESRLHAIPNKFMAIGIYDAYEESAVVTGNSVNDVMIFI